MSKKKTLSDEEYNARFGIQIGIEPEKKKLHKRAFKKAWKIRNFEIDKFWHRSAYFWGFIVLIFTGYFNAITGKSRASAKEMYLDLYLILLGCIFSVGWYLVICGSKRWQENWEKHIDKLEDNITGPLYKTVYYNGKTFYSVSKISQILSIVVASVWGFLFVRYIYDNHILFKMWFECSAQDVKFILFVLLPIMAAIVCTCFLFEFAQSAGNGYNEQKHGEFFDRYADDDA